MVTKESDVGREDRGNDLYVHAPLPNPLPWGERGLSGRLSVDQPSCARNHPRWHFAPFRLPHGIPLARAGAEDKHATRRAHHSPGKRPPSPPPFPPPPVPHPPTFPPPT